MPPLSYKLAVDYLTEELLEGEDYPYPANTFDVCHQLQILLDLRKQYIIATVICLASIGLPDCIHDTQSPCPTLPCILKPKCGHPSTADQHLWTEFIEYPLQFSHMFSVGQMAVHGHMKAFDSLIFSVCPAVQEFSNKWIP